MVHLHHAVFPRDTFLCQLKAPRFDRFDGIDQKVGVIGAQQMWMLGLQVGANQIAAVVLQVGLGGGIPAPAQAQFLERGVVGMAMRFRRGVCGAVVSGCLKHARLLE